MYVGEEASTFLGFFEWMASFRGLVRFFFLCFPAFCGCWVAWYIPCIPFSPLLVIYATAYLSKKKSITTNLNKESRYNWT